MDYVLVDVCVYARMPSGGFSCSNIPTVKFVHARNTTQPRLETYLQDENFGKSFMMLRTRGRRGGVRFGRFVFPKGSPKTIANQAVSSGPHVRAMQRELAPYLERFAHYFSRGFLLERLIMRLVRDQLDGDKDLNVIFSCLQSAKLITEHAPAEDTGDDSEEEEDGVPSDVRYVLSCVGYFIITN